MKLSINDLETASIQSADQPWSQVPYLEYWLFNDIAVNIVSDCVDIKLEDKNA